jgi:probable HAF family extracellular repeat protein
MLRSSPYTALCALFLSLLPAAIAAPYTITDLGSFHGFDSVAAVDINNSGVVVGGDSFLTTTTAYRWDGSLHPLPPLSGEPSAGATALNDLGQIVGESVNNSAPRAVRWTNDVPTLLPIGGLRSSPHDISNTGNIVGTFQVVSARDRAFLLEAGAAASFDLGTLGGLEAIAYAINDAGTVVGSAESANRNERAFQWKDLNGNHQSDAGEMTQYSDLGLSSAAYNINAQGVATGFVLRANFTRQASLWSSTGIRTDLPNLPGGSDAEAWDVNAAGVAVGIGGNLADAVIWQSGTAQKLLDLIPAGSGWTRLYHAFAINDDGLIVGFGARDGTGNHHAFVLTPTPEPGALGALGALLLIATARRRPPANPHHS